MGLWCFQRLTCDKGTSRFNWKRKINANLLSSFIMAFSSSRLCHLGSWMPRRHFKTWWIAFSLTCSKNKFLSFLTTFWYIAIIKEVLQLLLVHKLYAKCSKCAFVVNKIEYLGHLISAEKVEIDLKKVQTMKEWLAPKSLKELRDFLGLTGYYWRFIKGYGVLVKPLSNFLKKWAFKWIAKANLVFEKLKEAMVIAPILVLPNFSKSFEVEIDAT